MGGFFFWKPPIFSFHIPGALIFKKGPFGKMDIIIE
jgi:hypothetical protein